MPAIGLFGELICEACFDTASWIKRPRAQPPSVVGQLDEDSRARKSPYRRSQHWNQSVEELRTTFQRVGLGQPSTMSLESPKTSPSVTSSPSTEQLSKRGSVTALASRFGGGVTSERVYPDARTTPTSARLMHDSPHRHDDAGQAKVCAACSVPFFSIGDSGQVIQIPATGEHYHARCFLCSTCSRPFDEIGKYVELEDGKKVHVTCAPALPIHETSSGSVWQALPLEQRPHVETKESRQVHSTPPRRTKTSATFAPDSLPRAIREPQVPVRTIPSLSSASAALSGRKPRPLPRFGGFEVCAGCEGKASFNETVAGPSGSRFHSKCLVCVDCGKKLDAGAKVGEDGKTHCRMCFVSFLTTLLSD
jgi:LIM domain